MRQLFDGSRRGGTKVPPLFFDKILSAGILDNMKKKSLYMVRYDSRFGIDYYLVRSSHPPTDEEIIDAFNLDFEEGEYLEVTTIGKGDIVDIPMHTIHLWKLTKKTS